MSTLEILTPALSAHKFLRSICWIQLDGQMWIALVISPERRSKRQTLRQLDFTLEKFLARKVSAFLTILLAIAFPDPAVSGGTRRLLLVTVSSIGDELFPVEEDFPETIKSLLKQVGELAERIRTIHAEVELRSIAVLAGKPWTSAKEDISAHWCFLIPGGLPRSKIYGPTSAHNVRFKDEGNIIDHLVAQPVLQGF